MGVYRCSLGHRGAGRGQGLLLAPESSVQAHTYAGKQDTGELSIEVPGDFRQEGLDGGQGLGYGQRKPKCRDGAGGGGSLEVESLCWAPSPARSTTEYQEGRGLSQVTPRSVAKEPLPCSWGWGHGSFPAELPCHHRAFCARLVPEGRGAWTEERETVASRFPSVSSGMDKHVRGCGFPRESGWGPGKRQCPASPNSAAGEAIPEGSATG